jgi:hypothetical protein
MRAKFKSQGKTMKPTLLTTFCLLASYVSPVAADSANAPLALTYEVFEAAVPHIDLAACPDAVSRPDSFCRASVNHDEIHVFVFSEKGENPLIGFQSYELEGVESLLN